MKREQVLVDAWILTSNQKVIKVAMAKKKLLEDIIARCRKQSREILGRNKDA